jgi:hypothetical protein
MAMITFWYMLQCFLCSKLFITVILITTFAGVCSYKYVFTQVWHTVLTGMV